MKQMQSSVKVNNYVGTNGQVQSPVKPIKITPYKNETLKSDSKDIESNGPMIRQEDPQMTTEKSEDLKDDSPYISESEIIDDRDIDEADLEIIFDGVLAILRGDEEVSAGEDDLIRSQSWPRQKPLSTHENEALEEKKTTAK